MFLQLIKRTNLIRGVAAAVLCLLLISGAAGNVFAASSETTATSAASASASASETSTGAQASTDNQTSANNQNTSDDLDGLHPEMLDEVISSFEDNGDPVSQGEGFSAVLYNNTNGLPTSEANAIAQTEEGFIWIGSYSGLIRYDGDTFVRMDSTEGITSVTCLYVDSLNRLWIGTNDSGVAVMDHGEFRQWGVKEGMPSAAIRSIVADWKGTMYIGTTRGLVMIDNDLNLLYPDDERLDTAHMDELYVGADGVVYGLTNDGDVFTIFEKVVTDFIDHEDGPLDEVSCIYPDPDNPGYIYLDTSSNGVFYGRLNDRPEDMKSVFMSTLDTIQQFRKIGDQLWICARNGIGVINSEGIHVLSNLPMDTNVGSVMTDYENNLWFTSTRQGVMKIVQNPFFDLFGRNNIPSTVVNSTCMYKGRLFMGTDKGLMIFNGNGLDSKYEISKVRTASGSKIYSTDLIELLKDVRIRSITKDSRGRLWLCCWRGPGLLMLDNGEITAFTAVDGMPSDRFRAVKEFSDGSFVVAATGGVAVIKDDEIVARYGVDEGLTNSEILSVAEGPNGEILAGTDGGGIFMITSDGGVSHFGIYEGLSSEVVMRIKRDPYRDVYWIVTGNSIAYMTDDLKINTVQKFPYSNNFDLYANSQGEMWILSSNGIYVVSADELIANGDINPLHYSQANGLPCITTANSYSELTDDGDLYIAGTTGVAKVNIEVPFERTTELKMAVPYIEANGQMYYPDEDNDEVITLPSYTKKITIYSYVYNYSLSDPIVSYRLDGLDDTDTTVSRSELAPVDYTNLSGGTYYFVMQLIDPMSRGHSELVVKIVKQKTIFEQAWFYLIAGALVAFGIVYGIRLYIKERVSHLAKKHKEDAEKERINRELEMGANIQKSILPDRFPAFPDRSEFDIYASMDPAKEVGGDFYDFYLVDEDHLGMAVADVSGKGIPAALYMMIARTLMKNTAMLGMPVTEVLKRANEAICTNNKMEMFITAWIGILEISTGVVTAANAGHEYPAVKRGDKFEIFKDKHGVVLGAMSGIQYKEYQLQLKPGDKLFIYTDGVPEATSEQQELFGLNRLVEALNQSPDAAPEQILANVRTSVDAFVGEAEQFDDITMLCLEYKG